LSPSLGSDSEAPTISLTLSPSLTLEQPSSKPTPQPLIPTPKPLTPAPIITPILSTQSPTMIPSALAITQTPTMIPSAFVITQTPTVKPDDSVTMEPSRQASTFPPQVVSFFPTYSNTDLSQPPTIDRDLVAPAPSNPGDPISPSPTTIVICKELAKPTITVQIIMPRSYSYYGGKSGKAKSRKRQLHNLFGSKSGKSGKAGKSVREERDIIIDNDRFYELYCQNLDEMIASSSSSSISSGGGEGAVSIQNDDGFKNDDGIQNDDDATNMFDAFSPSVKLLRIPVNSEGEFAKGLPVVVEDEIEDVSSANIFDEEVDDTDLPKTGKVVHYYYPDSEVVELEKYAPLHYPTDDFSSILGRMFDSDVEPSSVAKSSIHGLGTLGHITTTFCAVLFCILILY
jgi:hypothetical protein